jgi:hypothetical protein
MRRSFVSFVIQRSTKFEQSAIIAESVRNRFVKIARELEEKSQKMTINFTGCAIIATPSFQISSLNRTKT